MQIQQGFRKLADERVDMVNGQVLTIRTSEPRTFAGGMQREAAAGQGYTPAGRQARREHRPQAQPAAHLRGRLGGRVHRPERQHRPDVPPDQGHRPPRDRARRRCRSTCPRSRRPTSTRPSRTGRWARPCSSPAASTRGSSTRRGAGWAPPIGAPDEHRGPRLPRRRDGQPRPSPRRRRSTTRDKDEGRTSRRTTRRSTPPAIPRPAHQEGQAVDPRARPRFRDRPRQLSLRTAQHRKSLPALTMSEPRRGIARPRISPAGRATGYNGSSGPCATSLVEAP